MTPNAPSLPTHATVSDLLWSQWRALGVPAATPPSQLLIDPEALIIQTAVHLSKLPDDRIYDGAVSWAIKYHSLISTARIKRLTRSMQPAERRAFEQFAGHVAQHVDRLTWPRDDTVSPWSAATLTELPNLSSAPALLRFRTRALFGANARGEAVAYLACTADKNGTDLASVARATGYSKRHLATPLEHLSLAGFVERWMPTNSHRYRLTDRARALLASADESRANIDWIDWPRRYQLLDALEDALAVLSSTGGLVAATALLKQFDADFALEGVTPLGDMSTHAPSDDHAERIKTWITAATRNLVAAPE